MMQKLVEIMGEEAYQKGIQEYLKTYAYGNATWDDLIAILDSQTEEDLATFSDVWVNQKGMPHITFTNRCGQLEIRQRDPLNRGLIWPQRFQRKHHRRSQSDWRNLCTHRSSRHPSYLTEYR